ncbi:MAG: RluA family pseudouridine synthase [Emcibacteraceae bacterium]|jgi:tRNA pseudouridine32 synthase/23S rRNA pseudouridine746 synthase|nr:RluA family pseudouridine synthase [Emcibacteraceae bacterium]MDC1428451.1 RluA family pseudouridine synthase [Emcibacteraceae bacterium]|tara:strand:+ start:118 stop:771 length:654 start_codon:yes stop_codon:yes gene_type:complete
MLFKYQPPKDPYLDIVYYDDDILILNKPSGLLSVPGKGQHLSDCLERRAQKSFPNALTVHRLDMDTSGLMVMGLNKFAHRHLSLQFQNRNVGKTYFAWVYGNLKKEEGMIDLPIICDWDNRPKQMVHFKNGKPSQTRWHVIKKNKNKTLVRLTPITGRTHQLRVHMNELGHPILGDRFYAHDEALNMSYRLCLHATEITVMQPIKKTKITFKAPVPF